jgi:phosphoglycerate dehydrogenase-like enzyme
VGHDLPGKVLGLVGMGRVGRCLAASAKALGMTVMSTDSSSSRCVSCMFVGSFLTAWGLLLALVDAP